MIIEKVKKNLEYDFQSNKYTNDVISYQVTQKDSNIVLSVPLDPANRHYKAILEWVAEGNKIEEAD